MSLSVGHEGKEQVILTIKVLTVRQPWADLIMDSMKDVENRNWSTEYRGPLYIHSGKQLDREGAQKYAWMLQKQISDLPRGLILGSVELLDVVFNESRSRWAERGAWHWILGRPRRLQRPIPLSGRQGLWTTQIDETAVLTKVH